MLIDDSFDACHRASSLESLCCGCSGHRCDSYSSTWTHRNSAYRSSRTTADCDWELLAVDSLELLVPELGCRRNTEEELAASTIRSRESRAVVRRALVVVDAASFACSQLRKPQLRRWCCHRTDDQDVRPSSESFDCTLVSYWGVRWCWAFCWGKPFCARPATAVFDPYDC